MISGLSLRDRVVRSRSAHCGAPSITQCYKEVRPNKYKPWNDEVMGKALESVRLEGKSVRRAAIEYGVPRSTLGDRISGRVSHGAVSGPPRYLSDEEEEELVRFLLGCASVGYAKTRKEVLSLVQSQVLRHRGVDRPVSHGWWDAFCKRHPNLTFRTPTPLSLARASAADHDVMMRYFDLLERTLEDNDLNDKPCQLFNMDETGVPLDPRPLKCVYSRGEKNPVNLSSGDKTQITVVACVSAGGFCIPPMVIWDRKQLSIELTVGEVPGTFYGLSNKGWMDQELFDAWFSGHFLRYAPPARPLLLLLDGHSSHYSPGTIRYAASEQVIIFALPPHTTHLAQPLDRGCFSPLKVAWREMCHSYLAGNPGKRVTRFNFSRLFCNAWMKAMNMRNILGGFRVTGVYPVNRNVIEIPSEPTKPSLPESSGLAYIPLYSPARMPARSRTDVDTDFTSAELEKFQTRYVNGYDLKDDTRYNRWLQMYHPSTDSSHLSSSSGKEAPQVFMASQCHKSDWQKLLTIPEPPPKPPLVKKTSGRVLTSAEHLKVMKEKEQIKQEEAQRKEERKCVREEKAKEQALMIEKKARERREKEELRTQKLREKANTCVERPTCKKRNTCRSKAIALQDTQQETEHSFGWARGVATSRRHCTRKPSTISAVGGDLTPDNSNSSESLALLPSPNYTFDSFQYMPTPEFSTCFLVTSTPNTGTSESSQKRKQDTTEEIHEDETQTPQPTGQKNTRVCAVAVDGEKFPSPAASGKLSPERMTIKARRGGLVKPVSTGKAGVVKCVRSGRATRSSVTAKGKQACNTDSTGTKATGVTTRSRSTAAAKKRDPPQI